MRELHRKKQYLIKKYGHTCGLKNNDLIDNFFIPVYRGHRFNLFARLSHWCRQQILVNENNMPTLKYCRSQYALRTEKRYHAETNRNLIHPLSNFRKYWEIFMIMIGCIILLFAPFASTFSLLTAISNVYKWQDYPRIALDLICVLDIVVNFRTGFYNEQREINFYQKDIAKHYLTGYFTIDLLSSIPPIYLTTKIEIYEGNMVAFYCNFIINQMKVFRLISVLNYTKKILLMENTKNFYIKLLLLIVATVFLVHYITCLCIAVSIINISLYFTSVPCNPSWITFTHSWNSTTTMMYATGLFRTACIISNAELGIMDQNDVDKVLVMILWVVARIMYIAFVCVLIQISRSLISSQTKYKEMVLQLMQYMHHKQLSSYTQNRIISYYEFRFQKSFFREQEILNTISGQLRQEILMLKCLKLVENVPFFKGLPQSLLMRIVLSLQLEIFLINDVIFKANSRGTSMYFISSGTIAIYTETGREIFHLHDGQHFGEVVLVMPDTERIYSVIAVEPCELYRLDRKDFMQIIRPYPQLFSSIENLAKERIQYVRAIDEKHRYFYEMKQNTRRKLFRSSM